MDIKKRIQELSLDQKAKLYFMGLVRKGIIDRLPDDPKAAYIRDMMDKEDPKMDPEIRSDFDDPIFENLTEIAKELGYLKETTISRGIEVEVMEDSIMINGSRLKELDIAYIEQAPNRIYRGYLHTDKGQVNLDGGEEGLNEFLRAAGAPVDEREYPHNIVEEYFMKYGVEVTTSEFDVS